MGKPANEMSMGLLANAQTLPGTKDLITNMKPMSRKTVRKPGLQPRLSLCLEGEN